MKRFASIKDCRRPSLKNFSKNFEIFFLIFLFFWNVSGQERWVFLLFPVGEEWFPRFIRIPSGIFWRCKIDEILTMWFYTWFSVWFCLFGFLQKFATFCASVCEARLRLCVNISRTIFGFEIIRGAKGSFYFQFFGVNKFWVPELDFGRNDSKV